MDDFLIFEPKGEIAFDQLMNEVIGKMENLTPELNLNAEFAEMSVQELFSQPPTITQQH